MNSFAHLEPLTKLRLKGNIKDLAPSVKACDRFGVVIDPKHVTEVVKELVVLSKGSLVKDNPDLQRKP